MDTGSIPDNSVTVDHPVHLVVFDNIEDLPMSFLTNPNYRFVQHPPSLTRDARDGNSILQELYEKSQQQQQQTESSNGTTTSSSSSSVYSFAPISDPTSQVITSDAFSQTLVSGPMSQVPVSDLISQANVTAVSTESDFMFYLHVRPLQYQIHKVSSYSPNYPPSNILLDRPYDINSCWSSDAYSLPQYIMLRLDSPAIITAIKFGKYEKSHFCNMKVFKVFGGLSEDGMVQLLDCGLKNDDKSETFDLKHRLSTGYFLCRYLKIVPIRAWKSNFYHSIWYVELSGVNEDQFVIPALKQINECRDREAVRLSLKHLRQKNYIDAFEALQKHSNIQLEDSAISDFYKNFVVDGDYRAAEQFIRQSRGEGLFEEYVRNTFYKPLWRQLSSSTYTAPQMRGGHSMVIDTEEQMIYLFGGYDGFVELDDFWAYHIRLQRWELLDSTFNPNSSFTKSLPPSARSCHQMCLDSRRKRIYILGRYIDSIQFNTNEFYMYDIVGRNWTLISENTEIEGGPGTIIDHQMCIDVEKNVIYILGGRIQPPVSTRPDSQDISGFYSYDVDNNRWRSIVSYSSSSSSILPLCGGVAEGSVMDDDLKRNTMTRVSHAMLFDDRQRRIYIFGGHRLDIYFNDMTIYDVDNDQMTIMKNGIPFSYEYFLEGYTLRATIDCEKQEIFVFTSLSISNEIENIDTKGAFNIKNRFWVYDIVNSRWSCVYRHEKNNTPSNPSDNFRSGIGIGGSISQRPDISEELFINLSSNSNDSIDFAGPSALEHIDMADDDIDVGANFRFFARNHIDLVQHHNQHQQEIQHQPSTSSSSHASASTSANNNNNSNFIANHRNVLQQMCNDINSVSSRHSHTSLGSRSSLLGDKPRARFAHQLVFDPINRIHYLFGGSADRNSNERLSDFWSLRLNRITSGDVQSKCIRLIRKDQFHHLSRDDKAEALKFLQTSLVNCYNLESDRDEILKLIKSSLFDQDEPDQTTESSLIAQPPLLVDQPASRSALLFSPSLSLSSLSPSSSHSSTTIDPIQTLLEQSLSSSGLRVCPHSTIDSSTTDQQTNRNNRMRVFDHIMLYFPQSMTQPKQYLEDFITDSTQFMSHID